MERISSLYPQYQRSQDRRQQNIPVAIDRRSGKDRRSEDRVQLDTRLTRDIFEVKKSVAKIEALAPQLFVSNVTKQAPTFGAKNNMVQDQLVISSTKDFSEEIREEEKLQEKASTNFKVGVIASSLLAAFALSFLGSAGIVIAIGTGLYLGARVLQSLVIKETNKSKNVD